MLTFPLNFLFFDSLFVGSNFDQILGGFDTVDYVTSENQPVIADQLHKRPFFRIALPVWRMPRKRNSPVQEVAGVTRDEIASIFGTDLVSRRVSRLHLTKSERTAQETNDRLRRALYSD